jgi:hypothetical protein
VIPVGAVEADDLVVGKNELDGYGLATSPRAMLGDLPETALRADFENSCGYLPRVKPLTFEVLGVDKDVADGLHRLASLCELALDTPLSSRRKRPRKDGYRGSPAPDLVMSVRHGFGTGFTLISAG